MRVWRWVPMITLVGVSLTSAGCGGSDAGTGPSGGPSGSYVLVGVNEDGLPEDEPMSWGTAGFRGGSLRLAEDGSWEMTIDFVRVEHGDSQRLQDYGQFDREGENLLFVSDAYGDEFEGTLEDDEVTITYDFDEDEEYESDFTFRK